MSAARALRAIHRSAPAGSSLARTCFCALLATPRCDLAIDPVPVDPGSELRQVWDLIQPGAKQFAFPVVSLSFGGIDPSAATTDSRLLMRAKYWRGNCKLSRPQLSKACNLKTAGSAKKPKPAQRLERFLPVPSKKLKR
jgi:hypothetical protein